MSGMERTKRQRVDHEHAWLLGIGVWEAVEESIRIGSKEVRYGVAAEGTPFWNWVVPTGGVLCWNWDIGKESDKLTPHQPHQVGEEQGCGELLASY